LAPCSPDLLIVERGVSRIAQQLLLEAGISVILNVPHQEIEYIARCTQAEALDSVEGISFHHKGAHKLGTCARFLVRNLEDDGGGKHAFSCFEGCMQTLGCTIMLRGGDDRCVVGSPPAQKKLIHSPNWLRR
jgi:1-phosphatidylinositol-3-phosphate 5-kinase